MLHKLFICGKKHKVECQWAIAEAYIIGDNDLLIPSIFSIVLKSELLVSHGMDSLH
jgi:hypothetical protein